MFYPAIEAVSALASALIIWYGGASVLRGTLTLGALVAFLQYAQRFFRPISDMSEKFNVLQSAMASSERIFKLLDEPVLIESPRGAGRRPAPAAGTSCSTTSGSRTTTPAPSGEARRGCCATCRFEVRPGERVGIVGATGSGKTTLINLLLRFYDVQRGRITIDGVDIRELDLADVARTVQPRAAGRAPVLRHDRRQHPAGQRGDHGRARCARRRARCTPTRSSSGCRTAIDAPVAERGSTLSVGQKQLLSFARALAFDPRVLILDEATSSVDTETELLIRDALATLMAGRTTIAIAHRLSTIQDMDKILVLHKGVLREAGTHQELLALRGHLLQAVRAAVQAGRLHGSRLLAPAAKMASGCELRASELKTASSFSLQAPDDFA